MRAVQQSLDEVGTALVDIEFAVLDLETTGGSPATDRITEVGVIKVCGGEVTGTFHTLVNPQMPIPPMVTAWALVPAAWSALLAFSLVGLASVLYLWLKDLRLDRFAAASVRGSSVPGRTWAPIGEP